MTDRAAAVAAIDGFESDQGPIDVLVNNAGMQHRAPLEEFPADAFDRVLATNLTSVFTVSQAVARHMIPRGRGRIVNIASVNAALARYSIAPYTATKGAVVNLTKGMATDWARHGLNCNAIAPGYIRTPLNEPLATDPAFDGWLKARTPAGRWGEARSWSAPASSSPPTRRARRTGTRSTSTAASASPSDREGQATPS